MKSVKTCAANDLLAHTSSCATVRRSMEAACAAILVSAGSNAEHVTSMTLKAVRAKKVASNRAERLEKAFAV